MRGVTSNGGFCRYVRYSEIDVHDVEQLPLVLVDALDLRLDQVRRIELDAQIAAQRGGQALLVVQLDRAPLGLELRIVGERHQPLQLIQIDLPARRRCDW